MFAKRLEQVRVHLGYSPTEMANMLGVSLRTLQNYVDQRTSPTAETLQKIFSEGVDVNWLISGEGQMLRSNAPLQSENAHNSIEHPVNEEVLIEAMKLTEDALEKTGRQITVVAKAKIVAAVYDELLIEQQPISRNRMDRYLRLVAG